MLVYWSRMSPHVVGLVHPNHLDPTNNRGGAFGVLSNDHLLLLHRLDLAGKISSSRIERSKTTYLHLKYLARF